MSPKKSKATPAAVVEAAVESTEEAAGATSSIANLASLEELARRDEDGVPFIRLDGVRVTTRKTLEAVLQQREKTRLAQLETQVRKLPRLEQQSPPPELELPSTTATAHAIASLRAVEDELKFQADLEQLCIPMLQEGQTEAGETTPIAHACSYEDLPQLETPLDQSATLLDTKSNLENIRSKLEQLRQHQEKAIKSPLSLLASCPAPPTALLRRQATFDIKRDGRDLKSQLRLLPNALARSSMSSPGLSRQPSTGLPLSPAKPPLVSCLSRMRSCPQREKEKERAPSQAIPNIVNQIGELFVQLQQQQHTQHLGSGPSSYLVTIAPTGGAPSCAVQPITAPKLTAEHVLLPSSNALHNLSPAKASQSQSQDSLQRQPGIRILAPNTDDSKTPSSVESLSFDQQLFDTVRDVRLPSMQSRSNEPASSSSMADQVDDTPDNAPVAAAELPERHHKSRSFLRPPSGLFRSHKK